MVKPKRLLHEAIRPLPVVVGLMRDLTRSRDQLIAENALLRQQLIVASRKVKRPVFKPHERGLMVLLASIVRGWRDAVLLVKPETILRWHREGFRLFWKWKSRQRKPAESNISAEWIALIRRMAQDNRLYVKQANMWSSGAHVPTRRGVGVRRFTYVSAGRRSRIALFPPRA